MFLSIVKIEITISWKLLENLVCNKSIKLILYLILICINTVLMSNNK